MRKHNRRRGLSLLLVILILISSASCTPSSGTDTSPRTDASSGTGEAVSGVDRLLSPEELAKNVGTTLEEVSKKLDNNGLSLTTDTVNSSEGYQIAYVTDKTDGKETDVKVYGASVKVQLHFMKLTGTWYFIGEVYYQVYSPDQSEQAFKDFSAFMYGLPFTSEPITYPDSPGRFFNNPKGLTPEERYAQKGCSFGESWMIQDEEAFTCVKPFLEEQVLDPNNPYDIYICSAIVMKDFGPIGLNTERTEGMIDLRIRIWPFSVKDENAQVLM